MRRLTGWDAFLLYSETPNVHMHTLKIAVVELVDMGGRSFGIDEFRQVIHSRLYKLHPLRYELVDIPFKFHHPMWRENCQVDLDYHVRPWTLPAPGGRRELDDAIGEIASTPLDRSRPLWEMYFVERSGQRSHRGGQQDPSRPGRRGRGGQPACAGHGSDDRGAARPRVLRHRSGALPGTVGAHGVPRPCAPDRQGARDGPLHRAGHQPGAAQFTQALTGADAPVHATAELHEPCAEAAAPVRHRDAVAGRHQGDQQATRRLHQRPGSGHVGGCTAKVVAALRRSRRSPAVGVGAGELRLLTATDLGQLLHRGADADSGAGRHTAGPGARSP